MREWVAGRRRTEGGRKEGGGCSGLKAAVCGFPAAAAGSGTGPLKAAVPTAARAWLRSPGALASGTRPLSAWVWSPHTRGATKGCGSQQRSDLAVVPKCTRAWHGATKGCGPHARSGVAAVPRRARE